MKIQEVIELAIKGGYWDKESINTDAQTFLDPLFWQALEKELGLPKTFGSIYVDTWQTLWHVFIDFLAEGKSAEDYFNQWKR